MEAKDMLPVALMAGAIYLLKIGGLSAVVLALRKLLRKLTENKDE